MTTTDPIAKLMALRQARLHRRALLIRLALGGTIMLSVASLSFW